MGLFDKVKGVAKDKIKDIDAQKEAMSIGKAVVSKVGGAYLNQNFVDSKIYSKEELKERQDKEDEKTEKLTKEFEEGMEQIEKLADEAIENMPEGPDKEKLRNENKARKGICPSCDASTMIILKKTILKEWEEETGTMNGKNHEENLANIRYAVVTPRKLVQIGYKCTSCQFDMEVEQQTGATSHRGRCLGVNGSL